MRCDGAEALFNRIFEPTAGRATTGVNGAPAKQPEDAFTRRVQERATRDYGRFDISGN